MTTQEVTVKVPSLPFKGPKDTDASVYRDAAKRIHKGYAPGGYHTTSAVVALLHRVAAELDRTNNGSAS